jgi:hypothetical protein
MHHADLAEADHKTFLEAIAQGGERSAGTTHLGPCPLVNALLLEADHQQQLADRVEHTHSSATTSMAPARPLA